MKINTTYYFFLSSTQ